MLNSFLEFANRIMKAGTHDELNHIIYSDSEAHGALRDNRITYGDYLALQHIAERMADEIA